MNQLTNAPTVTPTLSPLFLSDRLISLAEQAGQLGCPTTARRLIRLASTVLDEMPPPPAPGSIASAAYCAG